MEDKLSKYLETKYSFKLDESDIKMLDEDAPNLVSELVNWSVPDGDVIHVPDELDPLINSVSMQIGFLMHSQKSLNKTICDIVWRAHEFFHNHYPVSLKNINRLQKENENLKNNLNL